MSTSPPPRYGANKPLAPGSVVMPCSPRENQPVHICTCPGAQLRAPEAGAQRHSNNLEDSLCSSTSSHTSLRSLSLQDTCATLLPTYTTPESPSQGTHICISQRTQVQCVCGATQLHSHKLDDSLSSTSTTSSHVSPRSLSLQDTYATPEPQTQLTNSNLRTLVGSQQPHMCTHGLTHQLNLEDAPTTNTHFCGNLEDNLGSSHSAMSTSSTSSLLGSPQKTSTQTSPLPLSLLNLEDDATTLHTSSCHLHSPPLQQCRATDTPLPSENELLVVQRPRIHHANMCTCGEAQFRAPETGALLGPQHSPVAKVEDLEESVSSSMSTSTVSESLPPVMM